MRSEKLKGNTNRPQRMEDFLIRRGEKEAEEDHRCKRAGENEQKYNELMECVREMVKELKEVNTEIQQIREELTQVWEAREQRWGEERKGLLERVARLENKVDEIQTSETRLRKRGKNRRE